MEWMVMVMVGLQWLVIGWMLVTHRIEVKRLTDDLKEAWADIAYAANSKLPETRYPDTLEVPHPNRPGDIETMHHKGHGLYGPLNQDKPLSGVEEVEGLM